MHKGFLKSGALICLLAVVIGATAAHQLKGKVSDDIIQIIETAVRYQFYHGMALIITGMLIKEFNNKNILLAGKCFIGGVILFSGSLYLLSYLKAENISSINWIGFLTPLGGLLFIAGWWNVFAGIKMEKQHTPIL